MKTCPEPDKQPSWHVAAGGLWCVVALLLFWQFAPLVFGNKTLLPADILFQFPPYRASAEKLGVVRPHNPLYADLILQNYPWWQFIRQSLAEKQLPFWNPHLFAGTPFLAKGQHMAFYPLSLLFYFLPLARAYPLFILLHFGLAVCTSAFLARTVGISRFGALLSGMIYGLSGFMLAQAVFPMIIAAAAWLPLVLAMAERIISRSPHQGRPAVLPWILLGSLGLGMQALVGHPEILIYSLLTLAFYCLWRLIAVGVAHPGPFAAAVPWHALPNLAMLVALGLLIGTVQLLPQYMVLQENFRKEAADFNQVLAWAAPWQQAITLLVPNYFGNPTRYAYTNLFNGLTTTVTSPISWGTKNFVEGAIYAGILPLLLILPALRRPPPPNAAGRPSRQAPSPLLFAVLTVLALSFVFGTPLYFMVYILPGMEQIHSPFRWTLVSTLGIAILAGYGIDRLRRCPAVSLCMARACAAASILLLTSLLLTRLYLKQLEPAVGAILHHSGGNSSQFPDLQGFFSYEAPWFILLALLLAAAGLALQTTGRTAGEKNPGGSLWQPLVVLVVAADLLLFAHRLYPEADPALLHYTPDIVNKMQKDQTLWRFTTLDPESKKIFPANAGWLHGLQDIRGYDSIFPAGYLRYMETIDIQDELLFNRIAPLRNPKALDSPLLDLLNVKYVLTEHPVSNPRYLLAGGSEGLLLYTNTGALPRAFTLPLASTVLAEDPFDAMRRHDPRLYMILPAEEAAVGGLAPGQAATPTPAPPLAAPVASYQNNEVIISVTAREPVWLVLADSYDQGWKATVWPAGRPEHTTRLPVLRAYGALRAVKLGQGDWTVRFRYRPNGLAAGLILSLVAGGLTVTGLLLACRTSRNR
ncbi:MAG TPA: hypothetical protein DDY20_10440 [Desulfobulbaceae bacterium]|nr:hypothetical protein [Desulfobulbaceae bacterium]